MENTKDSEAKDLKQYIPRMIEYSKRGFPTHKIYCSLRDQPVMVATIFWQCYLDIEGRGRLSSDKIDKQKQAVEDAYALFISKNGKAKGAELRALLEKAGVVVNEKELGMAFRCKQVLRPPGISVVSTRLRYIGVEDIKNAWTHWLGAWRSETPPCAIPLDVLAGMVCDILKKKPEVLIDITDICAGRTVKTKATTFITTLSVLFDADHALTENEVIEEVMRRLAPEQRKMIATRKAAIRCLRSLCSGRPLVECLHRRYYCIKGSKTPIKR